MMATKVDQLNSSLPELGDALHLEGRRRLFPQGKTLEEKYDDYLVVRDKVITCHNRLLGFARDHPGALELGERLRSFSKFPPAVRLNIRLADQTSSAPLAEEAQSSGSAGTELSQHPVTCQSVAERLERLRKQGESFTSQHKLAEQLGCSPGTVNKAIKQAPSLKKWAKRSESDPRAQSLTEMVTDRTAQSCEPDPQDSVAIPEFVEQADPQTRASFLALPSDKQLEVVNDPDKHQTILGRKP
jgi:hypothetical protein